MLTNCTRTCSIDVLYRRQRTEGPGYNGGRAACIVGQWPQLVWQVATVLISPHSVSPLSSLRYPLSKLFTYPPIMPCFSSHSPSIFLFKTQNNWTFQSWNCMGFDSFQCLYIRFLGYKTANFFSIPSCLQHPLFGTLQIFRNIRRQHWR